MSVEKNCIHCKKPFSVRPCRAGKARFCSPACSKEATVEKTCIICGGLFIAKASVEKNAMYCSDHCRARSGPLEFQCNHCGDSFRGRSDRSDTAKFCSFACSMASKRAELHCALCFLRFTVPAHLASVQRLCSMECQWKWLEDRYVKTCPTCRTEFMVRASHSDRRVYCSEECRGEGNLDFRRFPEPAPVAGASWVQLGGGKFAIVDLSDLPRVAGMTWSSLKEYSVSRVEDGDTVRILSMHRHILGLGPEDPDVDHRNGDRSDNRRSNLRIATTSQNAANKGVVAHRSSSGYRGVHASRGRSFQSMITHGQKQIYLGTFEDPVTAAKFYDVAARELFGTFARLNFPGPGENPAYAD